MSSIPDAYQSSAPEPLLWLYVPWRWLVVMPVTVVGLLLVAPFVLIGERLRPGLGPVFGKLWARAVCLANFTRQRTMGAEHMDPSRGYVIVNNHQSNFDFALIAAIPGDFRWMMKAEVERVPVFGPVARAAGTVFIDRRNKDKSRQTLEDTKPMLQRGISLQMFPEGTRSLDGSLGEFKKGAFMIALQLGVPILPVTISGSGRVWPPKTLRLLPGRIDYTIHPPIDVREYGVERRDELMAEVRRRLESALPPEQRCPASLRSGCASRSPRHRRGEPES